MRNQPPFIFSSLKEQKLWSLDFCSEKFPNEEFVFHVLLKRGDGEYEDHGYETTASDAFKLRRELVEETGITRFFVRARRPQQRFITSDGDDDAALDFFRDKHAEGVGIEDIPRHLRAGYLSYCRTHGRSAR